MTTLFEVRFLVDNFSVDNPEQVTALLGQFDASAARVCEATVVTISVEASGPNDALRAVTSEVLRIEQVVQLKAVDVDLDLVDEGEIALRLAKSKQIVNLLARGERGQQLPPPYALPGGRRLWTWASIVRWLSSNRPDWLDKDEPDQLTREQQRQLSAWLTERKVSFLGTSSFLTSSVVTLGCTVPLRGAPALQLSLGHSHEAWTALNGPLGALTSPP